VTAAVIAGMGGTIPVGSMNLTTARAQAVLNATPGTPGSVTFTSNLLLNLVQQLITAELNTARGSTASTGVQAAITAANAGINVAIVGSQIREMQRKVGTPTITAITALSRRVRSE
jgi:hypothetical protein